MSDSDEMESFEISEEDYQPFRRRRKFTKEDAMLGIWSRSSEETGGRWVFK